MKTATSRGLAPVLVAFSVCLSASAATRVCSVYVESFSALQKQLFLSAEVFQAPALGALPMALQAGMPVPGTAQWDQNKPLAMHVLDMGDGTTARVYEASPSGTMEAYLQAALAAAGGAAAEQQLPVPENGIYTIGKGMAAKIIGGRLFVTQQAKNPSACLDDSIGKLSELPAIPGVIRVTVPPAALVPLIKNGVLSPPAVARPGDGPGGRAPNSATEFYVEVLSQLDMLHLGLSVQQEGLFLRTRLAPKAGTEMAAIAASGKPVTAGQLAFVEKDTLFSFATGGSALPERLKRRFTDFYTGLLAASPVYAASPTNELAVWIDQSFALYGTPTAFAIKPPAAAGGALLMQGVHELADPAGHLESQFAKMKEPSFKKLVEQSGMKFQEPVVRESNGLKIYSSKFDYDEQAMEKVMRAGLPPGLPAERADAKVMAGMETLRTTMNFLSGGYEYAAVGKNLFVGMGSPAMVEEAAGRAGGNAKASAEAERIEALLKPSADPHSLGRLALSEILRLAFPANPAQADAMKAVPAGEGIVFAGWPFNGEALSATLISASEIKSLTALFMAAERFHAGGGARPSRPPIPENF